MDDFDRLLKSELRRMLDPVVATQAPSRRRLRLVPETIPTADPPTAPERMPVAISVGPVSQH